MTKTNEPTDEEFVKKLREKEDEYYRELMEESDRIELMELDLTDITEEELFKQIVRDEREETI